jgi:ketosteroid isomerase-like protein
MSEQDNIAFIRRLYAAFGEGDVQTILDNVAEGVEWVMHGPDAIPYAGTRSGKQQVREFFRIIGDTTTGGKVTPGQFVARGDAVCSTARYTGAARNTGTAFDVPVAHLFTLRDGKVVRWEGYSDTARLAQAYAVKTAAGR